MSQKVRVSVLFLLFYSGVVLAQRVPLISSGSLSPASTSPGSALGTIAPIQQVSVPSSSPGQPGTPNPGTLVSRTPASGSTEDQLKASVQDAQSKLGNLEPW